MGKIKTFLTGGLIGAVVGVLFAPKKGDETRKELSVESEKLSGKAKDLTQTIKEKAQPVIDKVKEMLNKKI